MLFYLSTLFAYVDEMDIFLEDRDRAALIFCPCMNIGQYRTWLSIKHRYIEYSRMVGLNYIPIIYIFYIIIVLVDKVNLDEITRL